MNEGSKKNKFSFSPFYSFVIIFWGYKHFFIYLFVYFSAGRTVSQSLAFSVFRHGELFDEGLPHAAGLRRGHRQYW